MDSREFPLLFLWLVPSSGVAGMTVYCNLPWCPVCYGLLFQPHLCHIYLTYLYFRFGRPLLLFPCISATSTLLAICFSFIRPRQYHLNHFSAMFLDACATLFVHIMCSLQMLPLLVTQQINIIIWSHLLLVLLLVISLLPRSLPP